MVASAPSFSPIAIIGRGCVLPGGHDASGLERDCYGGPDGYPSDPEGRWRASRSRILSPGPDRALTDRGAFVEGFDAIFNPARFRIPAEEVAAADRLVQWLLHAGLAALGRGWPRGG